MLITDKPPLERIWSCLLAIQCDVASALEISSNLLCDLPDTLGYLTPISGEITITDDPAEFEEKIEALENAAYSGGADLSEIPRWTRLIRGALEEMRKESEND